MSSKSKSKQRAEGKQTIVGQFFHSFPNGVLEWQGNIIAEPVPSIFLVQLYEWFMGEPNGQFLVPLQQMVDEKWKFYLTAEEWHDDGVRLNKKFWKRQEATCQQQ